MLQSVVFEFVDVMIDVVHKILVPHQPAHLVARPRLRAMIETVNERQLVLLTAQAGYGKTSLLVEWAHTTTLPVCWYALDRFDSDPHTFVTYLAASILHRYPNQLPLTAALTQSGTSWKIDSAIATLGRELYAIGAPVVLVLDDWHLVDSVDVIGQALSDLLRRAPNCHAILASRSFPSLPDTMLLTAHAQVTGLAEGLLRFTPEEAAAVLERQSVRSVPPTEVAALTEKANGWITAIVLMARAPDLAAQAVLTMGRGSERRVYEFLTEQVFERLDKQLRTFLCESALLEDLQAHNCDLLLGRSDSAMVLDQLLRQHLFISELEGGILRYHPLFREFLIERFRRDDRIRFRETALRIAAIYVDQGQWIPAFDLCLMADDLVAARKVLTSGGDSLYYQGHLATLERCFGALLLDHLSATLLCLKGRLRLNQGQTQEAVALADLAQARMHPDEIASVRLFQAAVAENRGEYQEAISLAEAVLQQDSSDAQRGAALRVAANAHGRLGDTATAANLLGQALQIQRRRGDLYSLALLSHDLGVVQENAGQLHEAERCYRQADGYWTTIGNIGARALSRNNAAVVLHLLGRYTEAHTQLQEALRDANTAAVPAYEATIGASLGDLYCDLMLWDRAEVSYHDALAAGGSAYIKSYIEVACIRLMLYRRQFAAANTALDQLDEMVVRRQREAVQLLRAWSAYGRHALDQAHEEVRALLNEYGTSPDTIRALVLEARIVAEGSPSRMHEAVQALDAALCQARCLGHDAFLVAILAQQPSLLRRASLAGWPHATDLLSRIEHVRRVAERLDNDANGCVVIARALGVDQIDVDGAVIDIGLLKAREVWFYLLSHPRGVVADELREILWPDRDLQSSKHLLRTIIHRLRAVLPDDLIVLHQRRLYQIDRSAARIDYDVERFLELTDPAFEDPDMLTEGLELYRGPFLSWNESQWSQEIRAMLEQRFVQTLHHTGQLLEQLGRHVEALPLYIRALSIDGLDEAATAGAMRCYVALGNRAAAIDSYHRMRLRLDEDLGLPVDQHSEIEHIYTRILQTS